MIFFVLFSLKYILVCDSVDLATICDNSVSDFHIYLGQKLRRNYLSYNIRHQRDHPIFQYKYNYSRYFVKNFLLSLVNLTIPRSSRRIYIITYYKATTKLGADQPANQYIYVAHFCFTRSVNSIKKLPFNHVDLYDSKNSKDNKFVVYLLKN